MRDSNNNKWSNIIFYMKELMKNWTEKSLIGLLVSLNVLFLYYWIVLSANYCMHFDDVQFMWQLRDNSIVHYVHEMYMTRGGNFVGYGLNGIIFTIANWIGDYHFWPIVFYFLGIFITWTAFQDTSWIKNSGYKGWLGVITLYNVYVLTSVDYAVFTWLCAMGYYLFAPILCLIVKYLAKDSLAWWQWIVLIFLSIFIAGNAVSISTVTFMVLFANGMWMWYREGWNIYNTWNNPKVKRLLAITVLMLLCFAIVYVAPGNWGRMASADDIQRPQNLMQFVKAVAVCAGMFLYMMIFYLPYHIIAVALGAYVGVKYHTELPFNRIKAIALTIVMAIVYLLVSVLPLAYLSNGFQIQRNYIQIGFFYMLTFFVIGYLLTNNQKKDYCRLSQISISVCVLFLIVIMCLNIKQDLPVARAYNLAHQERESYLLTLQDKGQKETIIVEKFPKTQTPDAKYNVLKWFGKTTSKQAIYYESDTDVEPNEYEGHIRKLLKLDFDFVLAELQE